MKHVFIVGCPRSGTSWLQLLLAQHPSVATTQETHLFSTYLRPLCGQWERMRSRDIGMGQLLSDDGFYQLCAEFAAKVLQHIADSNPAATAVVEKTPAHVRVADLIVRLVPDAVFVHLVRDPRAVVSSLRAAADSWGTSWASPSVRANAELWVSDVTLGRGIAALTPRWKEVRYEDLRGGGGIDAFVDLLAWLEMPGGREFAAGALETCRIDRLRAGGDGVRGYEGLSRPKGFFRKGTTDAWRSELSRRELEVVEYIAGPLMRRYGYEPETSTDGRKPLRLSIADAIDRADRGMRTGLDKVAGRCKSFV